VAFLATVVASIVAFYAWAGTPQIKASANITLHLTLLRRKVPRPLRLIWRSIVWSPPLLMSGLRPRWSIYTLWLMNAYFCPHLVFNSGYLIEFVCLKIDLIGISYNWVY